MRDIQPLTTQVVRAQTNQIRDFLGQILKLPPIEFKSDALPIDLPRQLYFILELKTSTMSSSTSYTTEMVSISSGKIAAETEINIDEEYTAINDTGRPRRRPLPMPPAFKPPRPKKNFTLCHQPCKELCSYCVGSRLILSITVLVLTLAALGVLIYLLVTNIHERGPVPTPPTPTDMTTPEPIPGCPCGLEYELNFDKELKCELNVIGNTTISFNKVSGENINPILYQTGIRIPDNVPERGRFSAMWNPSGTLTTSINFLPVQCHDEGNYSLTVTSRKGTQLHNMYVKVIDHQYEPTISIIKLLNDGIENALQCHAITGCKNASLILEATQQKGNKYIPWAENLTSIRYEEGYMWKTNVTLNLTTYTAKILQNKCSRCTYSIGDKKYYSKPICIQIIPADFCNTRNLTCRYSHPYDCNKFVTCITSGPVVSICPVGLHYHQNVDNCTGQCLYAYQANCSIRLFEGCDCVVV